MFRARRAHHQERQIVSIQPLCPDDDHDVLETCRVINRNKYIEKNLCITLGIYQESLHDARSTKCKTKIRWHHHVRLDGVITHSTTI